MEASTDFIFFPSFFRINCKPIHSKWWRETWINDYEDTLPLRCIIFLVLNVSGAYAQNSKVIIMNNECSLASLTVSPPALHFSTELFFRWISPEAKLIWRQSGSELNGSGCDWHSTAAIPTMRANRRHLATYVCCVSLLFCKTVDWCVYTFF